MIIYINQKVMSTSSEKSDTPDLGIFPNRERGRLVSEPTLVPRGPIYGSSTMATQTSMLSELNHTEPRVEPRTEP